MVPKYILVGGEHNNGPKNVTFVAMRQRSHSESSSITAGDYNPYLYIFEGLLNKNEISIDYIFIDKSFHNIEWRWRTQVTKILDNSGYTKHDNIWTKGEFIVRIIEIKHEYYHNNNIYDFQDYIQKNTSNLFLTRTEGANFFDTPVTVIDNSVFKTNRIFKLATVRDSRFITNNWPHQKYLISPTYMELEPGDMNTRNGLSIRSSIQFSSENNLRIIPHLGPILKPIEDYEPLDEELQTFIANDETCYVCILITTPMKNKHDINDNKARNEMNVIIDALTALYHKDIRIITLLNSSL